MTPRHMVVMAAGTGGHIIPGLAVAREMQRRGWTVSWLGTRHGMENQLVPHTGIELDTIAFAGLRGRGVLQALTGGARLLKAFWDCLQLLRRRRPNAVLGMGGYVCFPGGMMAALLGRPLVLVNADAALLLSNRALLPVADGIAFGFEGADATRTKRAVVTGNPVRAEIESLPAPAARFAGREGPLRLLVVGGSLGARALNEASAGARALNEALAPALALIDSAHRPRITHQTGNAHHAAVSETYAAAGVEADIVPFIDDMAARLATCDLMICRAGAITVSELCAAGVPSVLVPLIVSTTSHQRDNAEHLARQGAAIHLPQDELSPARLAEVLRGLDRAKLLAMAERARALSRPHAAARVADLIEGLAKP